MRMCKIQILIINLYYYKPKASLDGYNTKFSVSNFTLIFLYCIRIKR